MKEYEVWYVWWWICAGIAIWLMWLLEVDRAIAVLTVGLLGYLVYAVEKSNDRD